MGNFFKSIGMVLTAIPLLVGCASANKPANHLCVSPLPSNVHLDSLIDCTVAASFNASDFDWQNGRLVVTIYNAYCYDAVDVSHLQHGDTIIYEAGKPLVVDSIERRNNFVVINGGIEQGGVELTASSGGTYRATTLDDHSVYRELGKRNIPLAADFLIVDCGENPTDPNDTIRSAQSTYVNSLGDYNREFSPLNTCVRIEGGEIKEIHRRWIP